MLIEADPSGEEHCTVNGDDIYIVESIPGYYDGAYEKLIYEDNSVVAGVISREGTEIRIKTLLIEDALFDSEVYGEYFPVCVRDCDGSRMEPKESHRMKDINKAREQARKIYKDKKK